MRLSSDALIEAMDKARREAAERACARHLHDLQVNHARLTDCVSSYRSVVLVRRAVADSGCSSALAWDGSMSF